MSSGRRPTLDELLAVFGSGLKRAELSEDPLRDTLLLKMEFTHLAFVESGCPLNEHFLSAIFDCLRELKRLREKEREDIEENIRASAQFFRDFVGAFGQQYRNPFEGFAQGQQAAFEEARRKQWEYRDAQYDEFMRQQRAAHEDYLRQQKPRKRPWYAVLGVPPDADRATIKSAYRRLAKLLHPDRGGSTEAMQELNVARDEGLAR